MSDSGFTLAEAAIRTGVLMRSDATVAALEIKILRRRVDRLEQRLSEVESTPLPAPPPTPVEITSLVESSDPAGKHQSGGGLGWPPQLPFKSKLESYALSLIGRQGDLGRSLAAAVKRWIDDRERGEWEAAWYQSNTMRAREVARISLEIASLNRAIEELELRHAAQQSQVLLEAMTRFVEKELAKPAAAFVGTLELYDGGWQAATKIEWAAWRSWHPSKAVEGGGRLGHKAARNLRIYEVFSPSPPPAVFIAPAPPVLPKLPRLSGRSPAPFWPDAEAEAMRWLDYEGAPVAGTGEQARLERHIHDWLIQRGHGAGEKTVRDHVKRCIVAFCQKRTGA